MYEYWEEETYSNGYSEALLVASAEKGREINADKISKCSSLQIRMQDAVTV
jgi:hypothetical protein